MQFAPRPSPRRLAGRAAVALAAATLLTATAAPARAAVYTWTGSHGSANWDAYSVISAGGFSFYTSNWGAGSSLIIPTSSSTTSLVFGSTSGPKTLTNNLTNPFSLNSLTFASGASAYTITGNPLAFAADGGTAPALVNSATTAQNLNTPVIVKDNLNVTVASTGDLSISGRLSGAAGMYKSGTGNLVLSGGTDGNHGSIAFLHVSQGPAFISGGTLDLTATGSTGFGSESSLFVEADSSLTINGGAHVTANGTPQIHNNGSLLVDGAGTSLHIASVPGTPADLRVGYAGGTSTLYVKNGATLTSDGDVHVGRSAYAANPGKGLLLAQDGGSITVAGTITIDGATDSALAALNGTITAGALASAGTSAPNVYVVDPAAGVALTVGTANTNSTFAGHIYDNGAPGSLQKVGSGTLTLSGQSFYSAGTILAGGTIRLGIDNALPIAGRVTFPVAAGTLDLNNHNQTLSGILSAATSGTITLGSGTLTIADTAGQSSGFMGTIQDGPNGTGGRVIHNGGGSFSLAGNNTYTGGTTVTGGGALVVSTDANLGAPTSPLTLAGGYLITVGSLSSARPVAVTADSAVDTAGNNNPTLSGALSGSGNLDVTGGGTLTISGTGTLGSLSTNWFNRAALVLDGANLTLTATGSTGFGGTSSLFVPDSGAPITIRNGTKLTTTGYPQLHNAASVTVDGATTVWTNNDPGDGNSGQIRVGYAGGTSTLAVRNGATVNSRQLLIGDSYFDQNPGVGTVTVSSGARVNVSDILWLMNGSSLAVDRASVSAAALVEYQPDGKPLSSVSLTDPAGAPGTALVLNRTGSQFGSFTGPVTDGPNGPGGITVNGAGWQYLYNASYSGPTTVNGGTLGIINNTHAGSFTTNNAAVLFIHNATLNPGAKSLTANGTSTIYYDATTINGGFLRGAGTHVFQNSTPSYVNGSTFLPGSHVTSSANLTLTNVTSGATITNYSPLTWDGGYNTAAGTLHVAGTVNTDFFENDGAIVVYNGATLSNTQSNLVSGGGSSITVNAGGTVKLNSTSLELHAATLVNNGTVSGGPTVVYANSIAKGSGTFGPLTLLAGGTFSPGNSPGTATTASSAWTSGGSYLFELARATGTAGTDWDLWHIDGNLTVTASRTSPFFLDIAPYNLPDFDPARSYDWTIADVTGAIINFDPTSVVLRPQGVCLCDGTYSLTQSDGNVILHYNPVPEPTTLTLLSLSTLPLLRRRRRLHP